MKKIIVLALLVVFVMPLAVGQVFAAGKKAQAVATDAGNKLCPVSGDPVSGQDFVEYQGKRYGLCCPMCKAPFLNDPKKYIAQMNAQEIVSSSAAKAAPADPASEQMEKDMEQGSL